jgi:hypothetical protein
MNIADINNNLKNIRKPAAKAAHPANTPNASALKARIQALKDKLITLEAELQRVSGTESRLVRMVKLS